MKKAFPVVNLVGSTVFLSLAALLVSPLPGKEEKIHRLGRIWAQVHLKACGVEVVTEGGDCLSEPPYIFMCNHQSTLDIFTLASSLPLPFRWVAKKELFSVPFLGWALKAGGHIPIDRENPRHALRSLTRAAGLINEGSSVVIFPEGTWGKDGSLLPFKTGGFTLALRTGAPIVPVGIKGTGPLQPEGHFVPTGKGVVRVRIGAPVVTGGTRPSDRARLLEVVKNRIEGLAG